MKVRYNALFNLTKVPYHLCFQKVRVNVQIQCAL